eukprot:gene31266-37782_t
MLKLPWIPRSVEGTVEKWLKIPASIVLIRGQRRCGKSSTVKRVADRLGKPYIIIFVKNNRESLLESVRMKFQCPVSTVPEIGSRIKEAVKAGTTIILEEIQNASDSFQVTLQECFDGIAYETLSRPSEWASAGSIFIMGSLPGLVDSLFEHRRNPLFERVSARITILQLDSLEMCRLFHTLRVRSPALMLSLHAVFQGRPHPYVTGYKAQLFKGDNTDVAEVVNEFFASELAADFEDALGFYSYNFGEEFAIALKAVHNKNTKKQQIQEICEKLKFSNDKAHALLSSQLDKRYQLIEPVFDLQDLTSVVRYDLFDSMLLLAASVKLTKTTRREDVQRSVSFGQEDLFKLEGKHFECWIREIAEDRYLLCREPSFPHLPSAGGPCRFLPQIIWNTKTETEIDIVASQPGTNTLILGSCKRSASKTSHRNMLKHFHSLRDKNNMKMFSNMLNYLALNDMFQLLFLHFVVQRSEDDQQQPDHEECDISSEVDDQRLQDACYVVSLSDMLQPFFQQAVRETPEEYNSAEVLRVPSDANSCCIM